MDNLAHALVGAALAEAGLKRRTGLGFPCLVIAANLPDLDVIGPLLFGTPLDFRRGWTHGPVGVLILPPLLAALLWSLDRRQSRRGTRPPTRATVSLQWLFGLSWLGALTHPLLDWLNTYGVRPLMPFSERWLYGDTLFVVDLWLWLVLLAGVFIARRRGSKGGAAACVPAIAGLVGGGVYVVAMGMAGRMAERAALQDLIAKGMGSPDFVMASPLPVNALKRHIVYRANGIYGFGDVDFWPGLRVSWLDDVAPERLKDPAVARAARQGSVAGYLRWSRLPYAEVWHDERWTWVRLRDARYRRVPQEAGLVEVARLPKE